MRKKSDTETTEERLERVGRDAQEREDSVANDDAIDAMVKRNIAQHGP